MPRKPYRPMSAIQSLFTSLHVGEWPYDENTEHAKTLSKATGMRVVEYGLAHDSVNAPWVVWVTYILDGEEVTAEAKSVSFPTPEFIGGLCDKIAVSGALKGVSPEGKDELLKVLGKM